MSLKQVVVLQANDFQANILKFKKWKKIPVIHHASDSCANPVKSIIPTKLSMKNGLIKEYWNLLNKFLPKMYVIFFLTKKAIV